MSQTEQPQPTHVAVPIEVWLEAVTTIGKEMTIEKGVGIWSALKNCKPIAPPPAPKTPAPENGATNRLPAGAKK